MVLRAIATTVAGVGGAMVAGPVGAGLAAGAAYYLFSEGYITLYHHTDVDSAVSIAESGIIYQSETDGPRDDARFGDGTYLTSLGPSASKTAVARNNYDGRYANRLHKTTVVIEVRVKKSKAVQCKSKRDIYLYKGNLCFKDVQGVRFHVRNERGGVTTYTLGKFKKDKKHY